MLENNASSTKTLSQFSLKLCKAFVAAGIPLKKLNNPTLREFLTEIAKETIPDESTLRKNYLQEIYESASKIKHIQYNLTNPALR